MIMVTTTKLQFPKKLNLFLLNKTYNHIQRMTFNYLQSFITYRHSLIPFIHQNFESILWLFLCNWLKAIIIQLRIFHEQVILIPLNQNGERNQIETPSNIGNFAENILSDIFFTLPVIVILIPTNRYFTKRRQFFKIAIVCRSKYRLCPDIFPFTFPDIGRQVNI